MIRKFLSIKVFTQKLHNSQLHINKSSFSLQHYIRHPQKTISPMKEMVFAFVRFFRSFKMHYEIKSGKYLIKCFTRKKATYLLRPKIMKSSGLQAKPGK